MNIVLSVLIALIVLGAVLYILQLLPIDETVKRIGYVVAVCGTAIWALKILAPLL